MQEKLWKNLSATLSEDRLGAYGKDGAEREVVIARYLWNSAVCESLYAPLQMCEVGLRNSVHRAMVQLTGQNDWHQHIGMTHWATGQVEYALRTLRRRRKPVTDGRVVAELNFGFWTSMFESHYERRDAGFLPRGIKLTFPQLPKSQHHRKRLKRRLDGIRNLRNRVFHYERVIHWKDLVNQHQGMLEAIGWMCGDLEILTSQLDTFPSVYSDGIDPHLEHVREVVQATA